MNGLIEQSEAYWNLGMAAEARALAKEALAAERDASGGDTTGPAAEWCARLAFSCGDFASVATRGLREPRFPNTSSAISSIALSLHYLGRHDEAAEALSPRLQAYSRPHDHYQMACMLAQAGRADEAVAHLFQSLPHCRDDRRKTWLDGDLKHLWSTLAAGGFSLATAHRLVEREFDILREWQPARHEDWPIDPPNFHDLPAGLRQLFEPVPRKGEHRRIPAPTLAAPALVERLDEWARDQIAANRRALDAGRGLALRRVLDVQPHYARLAWERGDVCALRYHVQWAARHDPARIRDFGHIAGIGPLLDEVRRMLASDAEFFVKLERAAIVAADDVDAALEIIGSLPHEWSGHPLILLHRAFPLSLAGRNGEALPLLLSVCSQWPDDAAGFLNAVWAAMKDEMKPGRSEVIKMVRAHAPRAARDYRMWTGMEGWLGWAGDYSPMETFEVKSRPFRGQPDLGGHLAVEIMPPSGVMAA
jgi:tetratricopeptide (TPR) repeat protein